MMISSEERGVIRRHLAACLFYHTGVSVMIVVSMILVFVLEKQRLLAQGVDATQAALQAGGVVFWIATIVGAMRIPGAHVGAWLSGKMHQRNLVALSAILRAAVLISAAVLVYFHAITLLAAAIIYSADWFFGGLEEVGRYSVSIAMVGASRKDVLKHWSTQVQGWAESTGVLGPSIVLALTYGTPDTFDRFAHWIGPSLLLLSSVLFLSLPKDLHLAGSISGNQSEDNWRKRWNDLRITPKLLVPTLAIALVASICVLKGPLSTDLASILLNKQGVSMKRFAALLSAVYGAGSLVGFLLIHKNKWFHEQKTSQALRWSGYATALLAFSWISGLWPAIAFWPVAGAWLLFAMADVMARIPLNILLQHEVAAEGAGKKYVLGLAISIANIIVVIMRVIIGLIFFVIAGTWQLDFSLVGALLLLFAFGQFWLARDLEKIEAREAAASAWPNAARVSARRQEAQLLNQESAAESAAAADKR